MGNRLAMRTLFAALMSTGLVAAVASGRGPARGAEREPAARSAPPRRSPCSTPGLQVCDECVPDILVTNHDEAGAAASSPPTSTPSGRPTARPRFRTTPTTLRQGSTLPTSDAFTSSNGTITATFEPRRVPRTRRSGRPGSGLVRDDDVGLPHLSHAVTIPCDLPPLGGPPRVCDSGPRRSRS